MKSKARLLMSLKIWTVIYPSITVFYLLFGSHLAVLPLLLRTFVLTIALVPWMMFIGVPFLDVLIKWLSEKQRQNRG
jgi:antibiotic biosynthesis monooxygenase (ABM) superfamily enzyme